MDPMIVFKYKINVTYFKVSESDFHTLYTPIKLTVIFLKKKYWIFTTKLFKYDFLRDKICFARVLSRSNVLIRPTYLSPN